MGLNYKKPVEYPDLLTVSPPPHIKHPDTTTALMADVIIALLPATVWSVIVFGLRALIIILISVLSSVLFVFLS